MILVDTSVWIDHLRQNDSALNTLLETGQILTHPFVIGELAMGNMKQREVILRALNDLPKAIPAGDAEVLHFITTHTLFGLGIGYVDAHLLAATKLTPNASLWTRDKRLHKIVLDLALSTNQRR
jgi:hypothetical protein